MHFVDNACERCMRYIGLRDMPKFWHRGNAVEQRNAIIIRPRDIIMSLFGVPGIVTFPKAVQVTSNVVSHG